MRKPMSIWLALIVPPLLILCAALIVLWLPLPRPFPPAMSKSRNVIAAAMAGLLGVAYLAGLVVYLLSAVSGTGRALEAAFPAGTFTSRPYMLAGRQYAGTVAGRQVSAEFIPARGVSPALLNVYVSARVGTRMAVGEGTPLLDCAGCPRIDGAALGHLTILAEDEAWARRLLADPASHDALARLLADGQQLGLRELYVQPGRLWLRAHPTAQVAAGQVTGWMEDMQALAGAVER